MRKFEPIGRIKVGLIKGRHDMPVSDYIFDKVEDIFDYDGMRNHIDKFIYQYVGFDRIEYDTFYAYRGKNKLEVYVTGLTSVACALVDACNEFGVPLVLMHYDRDFDAYRPQVLSTGWAAARY